ncbi:MAG: HNH endonuclease [Flavobacterium nitrogenifigens]|uniref:HNH endonuclease n=1 Tax=Flavobacterium nitrogenifigens TaxID=1617283 RepID=UPI00280994BC|nr:HNH endonuclease [Flavobacterium nitrogenifigens]MDQ8014750.1 HNH endonuclease [Flavobacterium nitrogenifigens]
MKKCIWCLKSEQETEFKKQAHTIPQSLGGKEICENVCDECNIYFGSYEFQTPSVELIIKETFNISRARCLAPLDEIGKNKALAKFSSIYFNVNFKQGSMNLKPKYKLHKNFQETVSRQLKRGLYKIFLEETERQNKDGHSEKYNFIRNFSRYNEGDDLPVFYFIRRYGVILINTDDIKKPKIYFPDEKNFKYLIDDPLFFEFELLCHVFGIATSSDWKSGLQNYLAKTTQEKKEFFRAYREVKNFNDVDLTLSILND